MLSVVIQCAGSKQLGAGTLRDDMGRSVRFVASPSVAPTSPDALSVTPDSIAADGKSWRQHLLEYNDKDGSANPCRLLMAGSLYRPQIYRALVDKLGALQVFILSAGWGLIRSDFLTPDYNITFSAQAEAYARRRTKDVYHDFRMLGPGQQDDEVRFFGGTDYLPHFARLTDDFRGRRIAYFKAQAARETPGLEMIYYETRVSTNWHYEAAEGFLAGRL